MKTKIFNEKDTAPGWYKKLTPFIKGRNETALELLDPGNKLLDLGCGYGELAILASEKFANITGIDIDEERLKRAKNIVKKLGLNNINFQQIDANRSLPFKNESFDTVTALSVIESIENLDLVIEEIHRILEKNGTFIVDVPNIGYLPERIKLLFGKLPGVARAPGWQGGRLHQFTVETLSNYLKKKGFSIKHVSGWGFLKSIRRVRPSLLLGEIIIAARKK
ncbi:MAG: S-adenosylmethionine (SAM)-dependent methyltransferase [Candidatus Gottesmanbacteria bacterium GW2011_GWC2_39_8]|uniref:Arsenite methyltransferase n=1 Tax=Candidatus Gottesmanbacteria bacterium GW2011_GWC2_39_8 TaxID=1618450 RepID=A0A0G0PUS0_9BACT|nr:MAG: S-adenosylmethionine (SAM)-dependent methyltransferase [Candidatus Gottesmanbacteria bacterium GW2011_GWC2_39_8]